MIEPIVDAELTVTLGWKRTLTRVSQAVTAVHLWGGHGDGGLTYPLQSTTVTIASVSQEPRDNWGSGYALEIRWRSCQGMVRSRDIGRILTDIATIRVTLKTRPEGEPYRLLTGSDGNYTILEVSDSLGPYELLIPLFTSIGPYYYDGIEDEEYNNWAKGVDREFLRLAQSSQLTHVGQWEILP